jgi:hypothetical protein
MTSVDQEPSSRDTRKFYLKMNVFDSYWAQNELSFGR